MSNRYQKTSSVVERKIRGEHILVPLMGTTEQLDSLYTLNASASFVWELAVQKQPAPEIVHRFADSYKIDFETAQRDVTRILEELLAIRALEPAAG